MYIKGEKEFGVGDGSVVEAHAAGVWETEFLSHEIMQTLDTKAHHLWLCSHRAEEERQVYPRGCLHDQPSQMQRSARLAMRSFLPENKRQKS